MSSNPSSRPLSQFYLLYFSASRNLMMSPPYTLSQGSLGYLCRFRRQLQAVNWGCSFSGIVLFFCHTLLKGFLQDSKFLSLLSSSSILLPLVLPLFIDVLSALFWVAGRIAEAGWHSCGYLLFRVIVLM